MPEKIPISKPLAEFIREKKEKGRRERDAKIDTAFALTRKDNLAKNPYSRTSGGRRLPVGVRLPVRNLVEMTGKDSADLKRLDREIGDVGWREFLRSTARAEPDIVRPKRK